MKLLSVCIKKYGQIFENQIFNISPDYIVDFSFDTNEISITKKNNVLHGIYGKAIYSISAIVGKNGVGKSSLLNLIGTNNYERALKARVINESGEDSYICVYATDRLQGEDIFYVEEFNLSIKNINKNNSLENICNYYFTMKSDGALYQCEAEKGKIDSMVLISDRRSYYRDDLETIINNYNGQSEDIINKRKDCDDKLLYIYKAYVLLKELEAIKSNLSIVFKKNDRIKANRDSFDLTEIDKVVHKQTENIFVTSIQEGIDDFYRKLFVDIVNHFLLVAPYYNHDIYGLELRIDTINPKTPQQYENCFDLLQEEYEKNKSKQQFYTEIIFGINKYKELYLNLMNIKAYILPGIDSFAIRVPLTYDKNYEMAMDSLDKCFLWTMNYCYKAERKTILPFTIDSFLVSNGEEKLIRMIAGVMSEVSNYCSYQPLVNAYNSGNIIVLIDEIELGMHPEWCRHIVEYIVKAINNVRINVIDELVKVEDLNNTVQLIVSTHSPYVLSDIVTGQNIFLELEGEKSVQKNIDRYTFAANPIELLKNDFFVDGYMGGYSNVIINSVLRWINNENADTDLNLNNETVRAIVSRIGEPILKFKLEEMVREKKNT